MRKHDDYARIHEHIPEGEDLTLITLKAHLLAEELLDEIIAAHCRSESVLGNVQISFAVKLKLAAALSGRDDLSWGWDAGQKLNSLRNALAHTLDHPKTGQRLDAFLQHFRSFSSTTSNGQDADDMRSAAHLLFVHLNGARASSLGLKEHETLTEQDADGDAEEAV